MANCSVCGDDFALAIPSHRTSGKKSNACTYAVSSGDLSQIILNKYTASGVVDYTGSFIRN